jgi:hypothetical protein
MPLLSCESASGARPGRDDLEAPSTRKKGARCGPFQTWGRLASNQVNLTECLLSDIAENAASFSDQPLWLVAAGGEDVGLHLGLLNNYFPGYTVTWPGAFIGFFYGALCGAIIGWSVAWIYNEVADNRASS